MRTIDNNLEDYITYEEELKYEAYFKLYNLPVSPGGIYADIWLYNSNSMAKADRDVLEHITARS